MCVLGILLALFERATKSGKGQVVDVDMVRGTDLFTFRSGANPCQQVSGARYISLFALVHANRVLAHNCSPDLVAKTCWMEAHRFMTSTPVPTVAGCRLDVSNLSFSRRSSTGLLEGLAGTSHWNGDLLRRRT
jgi:hypothetical protein